MPLDSISLYTGCELNKNLQNAYPFNYQISHWIQAMLNKNAKNSAHKCKVFLESNPQNRVGNVEQRGPNADE